MAGLIGSFFLFVSGGMISGGVEGQRRGKGRGRRGLGVVVDLDYRIIRHPSGDP